ncbi:hypothetical protein WDZ17_07530 [Pseudokineococcus basanitobsidens]|uniref:Integral membrane protein n=1 Tax=Pseudokineococcus basanitobsidens TaxID=1926649 RepID=A0ABU8RJE0_9ACTN
MPHPSRTDRRPQRAARAVVGAACGLYAANCALGASVGLHLVDTSRAHWVHHALYGAVVAGALGAVAAGALTGSRAGLALVPALVPLAVLPRVRAPSRAHVLLAASAAPAYAAAVHLARHPS